MPSSRNPLTPWARRRAERRRRKADRLALRAEFELEPQRGFARLRAFAAGVSELERERLRSHADPAQPPVSAGGADSARTRASRR